MRILPLVALALACGGAPRPPAAAPAPDPVPVPVPVPESGPDPDGRLPADTTPTAYRLSLRVDPAAADYSGVIEIDLTLATPRQKLWLHGNPAHVVADPRVGGQHAVWRIESEDGLASLTLPAPVGPGKVVVTIPFRAPYEPQQHGFFKVTAAGRPYAFTKFEPQSARVAFPCLDEPSLKASFELTLEVPPAQIALANTQIREERQLPDSWRRIAFVPTAPLSTYLFAWAVGPFDVVEKVLPPSPIRARPLKVRGVAAAGRGPELAHALSMAQPVVEELEGWFGTPFPWDKVDLVAAPSYPSGAMENSGAIMFRDTNLLVDPEGSSDETRANVVLVMAHELAHEWFGNLVTMAWWEDLWLNEAFAEWMGVRVTSRLLPAARAAEDARAEVFDAMEIDSLPGARAIRQPVRTSHDARNAFDSLTYQKGQGVLVMTQRWLGEEHFRAGVRRYLEAHRLGNARAGDLFAALGEASGQDVAGVLETFLLQPGVPLVDVEPICDEKQATLRLTQKPYVPLGVPVPARRWRIPFCATTAKGGACALVGEGETLLPLPGTPCGAWFHPNAGGAGYYRFSLPPAAWRTLGKAWPRFSSDEKLAIADAVRAGFEAGTLDFPSVAPWLARFAAEPDRTLATVTRNLAYFAATELVDDATRPRVRAWVRRIFARALVRVKGVEPRPGDPTHVALYRRDLAEILTRQGRDPKLRRSLAARGRTFVGLGGGDPRPLPPELVALAIELLVADGGAAEWEAVHAAITSLESGERRRPLLRGLAHADDEALALRSAALAASPDLRGIEPLILLRDQVKVPETRLAVWRWVRAHLDEVAARLARQQQQQLVSLGSFQCDEAAAAEMETGLAATAEKLVGGPRTLRSAVEEVRVCAAIKAAQAEKTRAFFAR